ncbi:hypothetical protein F0562_015362 [Nyssa sinensis]|uniref:3'-5' exonuclease domain-containing protein n=1 Tax=Nyssa sinensis TaxID=561372 RepID=A0A5J4ZK26_9ASTE|nr:hypothetical protein F0562_015362 [Nyssa sinensis]
MYYTNLKNRVHPESATPLSKIQGKKFSPLLSNFFHFPLPPSFCLSTQISYTFHFPLPSASPLSTLQTFLSLKFSCFSLSETTHHSSAMNLSIIDYELPNETHNLYDVIFFNDQIHTLVTHTSSFVDEWISEIENLHQSRLQHLIVGLDVEWRPNFNRNIDNPVATLQLCISRRCLIFQLLYASDFPKSLIDFLGNSNYTFVGVGIGSDVEKLTDDHGLVVATTVDLRSLAAEQYGMMELRNAGLKALARQVLGKEIEKPRSITLSRWDKKWLTPAQMMFQLYGI